MVTDAVIVVDPTSLPVTTPAATVAMVVSALDQVTVCPAGVVVATNVVVASSTTLTVCLSRTTP